jgi:hypothetical protein
VETVSALTTEPTVYVSQNGNDSNSGLAWGQAFLTIGQAITHLVALSGGTGVINVGPGAFHENLLSRPSGCWIVGAGSARTTIKLANAQNTKWSPTRHAATLRSTGTAAGFEQPFWNVTEIATLDRQVLEERIGALPDWLLAQIDAGIQLALGLPRIWTARPTQPLRRPGPLDTAA